MLAGMTAMTALERKQHTRLSRALRLRIKHPAPRAVVAWAQDHLRLPESDMRRMKRLYDKAMEDTITPDESGELDGMMEACAAMDLLRARLLFAGDPARKPRRA